MKLCILCAESKIKTGLLCGGCANLVGMDAKYKLKYEKLKNDKKKQLNKYRDYLLKNMNTAQISATKYVEKVARVYRATVQKEKIINTYIIDIYVPELELAIEIDGGVHNISFGYDDERDDNLANSKIKTVRFSDKDVGSFNFKSSIWALFHENYINRFSYSIYTSAKKEGIYLKPIGSTQ